MSRWSRLGMGNLLQLVSDHVNVFLALFPISTFGGKLVSDTRYTEQ